MAFIQVILFFETDTCDLRGFFFLFLFEHFKGKGMLSSVLQTEHIVMQVQCRSSVTTWILAPATYLMFMTTPTIKFATTVQSLESSRSETCTNHLFKHHSCSIHITVQGVLTRAIQQTLRINCPPSSLFRNAHLSTCLLGCSISSKLPSEHQSVA